MRARADIVVLVALVAAGCKFPELPAIVDDAGVDSAMVDAPVVDASVDAPPPCEAGVTVCDDSTDVYTRCSATGTVELQFDCALGCADDREQCVEFVATNGVTTYVDQARDLPPALDVVFSGASTLDTSSGVVFNGGTAIDVPNADAPNGARVFMFRSIVVSPGATLTIIGNASPILVAGHVVEIQGVVDASANGTQPGPGIRTCNVGDGALGFGGTPPNAGPGAGGAGGWFPGGQGGTGGNGTSGAAGGAASVVSTVPLRGGCDGGQSFNGVSQTFGGAGGGALQITSRLEIRILGSGVIDASGGGGQGAMNGDQYAGAGGGSGGAIVLEAPQIILDGAGVAVSTKGGGGAAAGTNASATRHGADGGYGPEAAAGGTAVGMPRGGNGGIDAPAEAGESATAGSLAGGGGGGSGGRTLIVTRAGTINPQNGAAIRSSYTSAAMITRFAP